MNRTVLSPNAWVSYDGTTTVPPNAISKRNSLGNNIVVCRGPYKTYGVHPGYLNRMTQTCSIGYGGKEQNLQTFEILTGDM